MPKFRQILPGILILSFVSFAVPAQKRKARTAKPSGTANAQLAFGNTVEPINVAGLKDLISRQKDKPLLVNFWATWCDPCRDEFPELVKIDAEYRPRALDFVTVSLDDVKDIKTA